MSEAESLIDLEAALLAAHEKADKPELVALYSEAGEAKERSGDIDAACFYFTHAYVFALEIGHPRAEPLLAKLVHHGRDAHASD